MIELDDGGDGIGWCICGAAWFELAQYDDVDVDPEIGAAVCINPVGDITGYAGKLVCLECGTDWMPAPPHPPLRLIQGGAPDG